MNIKNFLFLIYNNLLLRELELFDFSIYNITEKNPDLCIDNNKYCDDWSKIGECKINKPYMLVNCQKSCNVCDIYRNHSNLCKIWALSNECEKNPKYMLKYCGISCLLFYK